MIPTDGKGISVEGVLSEAFDEVLITRVFSMYYTCCILDFSAYSLFPSVRLVQIAAENKVPAPEVVAKALHKGSRCYSEASP